LFNEALEGFSVGRIGERQSQALANAGP